MSRPPTFARAGRAALAGLALLAAAASTAADGAALLVDGERTGLDFHHFNGMSGELYFVEMMGAGGALLDCDGDGDLDLYLAQGHMLGGKPLAAARLEGGPQPDLPLRHRLFRNDLEVMADGGRALRFTDVTEASGLDERGYGMGAAVGDVDNDGNVDLYVTNYGPNRLWRNRGDCRFEAVDPGASGLDDPRWSIAAAFLDADGDGWLDLYVGNYVDYNLRDNKLCPARTGGRDYCSPDAFAPVADRLLRNRGAEKLGAGGPAFEDVSAAAGLADAPSPSLGVASGDFDGDGRIDLFVANDGKPNQLWLNRGGAGKVAFVDEALLAGCAVNADGQPEASMGVAAGDLDGDGNEDLFMTHLANETNTVYLGRGGGDFLDVSRISGLGLPSWRHTGFGTAMLDLGNDGRLDVVVVNGGVTLSDHASHLLAAGGDAPRGQLPWRLDENDLLFRNLGTASGNDVRFAAVEPAEAGAHFGRSEVGRGLLAGDLDNDGDTDLIVTNNHGPARVLLDPAGQDAPWVGARIVDRHGRDALGAAVTLVLGGAPAGLRRVRTDGSYASAGDPRVRFGLGYSPPAGDTVTLRVAWPGGEVETFDDVAVGRYTTLREGASRPRTASGSTSTDRP